MGVGRYATVYQSSDHDGNRVAIKVPHIRDRGTGRKLELEASLLGRTHHPHFVRYIDHNFEQVPYLVMEYVPENLQGMINKNQVDQRVVINYIAQIPQVLRLLQEYGLTHCDLKPDNIGYSEGQLKVLDFGLAIPFDRPVCRMLKGDNPYLPPEFKKGLILSRSDTYSAGRTLETLIVGHNSDTVNETITTIELFHQIEKLPAAISTLISGMIQPNHLRRKGAQELVSLAEKAVKLLEKRDLFSFKDFATVRLS